MNKRYNRGINSRSSRVKARRRRNRFLVKLSTVLMMCAMIGIMFVRMNLYAESEHQEAPVYKYYTSICINDGDTLERIARERYTIDFESVEAYIKEVKFINHLKSDELIAGGYLIVPYYSVIEK